MTWQQRALKREGRGMRHLVEGEGEGERGNGLLVMTTEAEFNERGRRGEERSPEG